MCSIPSKILVSVVGPQRFVGQRVAGDLLGVLEGTYVRQIRADALRPNVLQQVEGGSPATDTRRRGFRQALPESAPQNHADSSRIGRAGYGAAMPIFFFSSARESAPAPGEGAARARSMSSSMVPPTSASWS